LWAPVGCHPRGIAPGGRNSHPGGVPGS
jgi:hypothetical protein